MITQTNLDIYVPSLRMYIGDTVVPYTYSDTLLLTALVESVRYLSVRWSNKYLIYSPDMLISDNGIQKTVSVPEGICTISSTIRENDMFKNCYYAQSTTFMDIQDQAALLLAAAYLMRRSLLNSTSISNWSTPDLSFSNVEASRSLRELIKADLESLDALFKRKLGHMQVGRFSPAVHALDIIHSLQTL